MNVGTDKTIAWDFDLAEKDSLPKYIGKSAVRSYTNASGSLKSDPKLCNI